MAGKDLHIPPMGEGRESGEGREGAVMLLVGRREVLALLQESLSTPSVASSAATRIRIYFRIYC